MKVSERFVCPPPGEDKRRYVWWARRVLDECNLYAARYADGSDSPAMVQFSEVPEWAVAYLLNEFVSSGLWKLVSVILEEPALDRDGDVRANVDRVYIVSLLTPALGKTFSAAAIDWYHDMLPKEKKENVVVFGGKR